LCICIAFQLATTVSARAQICNNSTFINKTGDFRNSKYDDLEILYRTQKDFDLNSTAAKWILSVLDKLNSIFGTDAKEIRNRASTVTIFLLTEEMMKSGQLVGKEKLIKKFYLEFLRELQKEVRKGIDFTNRFLMQYQSNVIQAADSKGSIANRHESIRMAFNYFIANNRIIETRR
jgi:hypothetical protein